MENTKMEQIRELCSRKDFIEQAKLAKDTAQALALLKEYGFELTEDELAQFSSAAGSELNEAELDTVSGGGLFDWLTRWIQHRSRKNEKGINELMDIVTKKRR